MMDGEDVPQLPEHSEHSQLAAAELADPVNTAPTVLTGFRAFLRRVRWHHWLLLVGTVVQPLLLFFLSQSAGIVHSLLELWFQHLRDNLGIAAFFWLWWVK
jgi:small neutral amino acid transporter SnatA (MarC family)